MRYAAASAAALFLIMVTGSCIITTDPQFTDPPRGTPFLLGDRVTPDPRSIIFLDPSVQTLTFDAFVQSEDADQPLLTRLLLDYGHPNFVGIPYRGSQDGPVLPAKTFADGPRLITATFDPSQFGLVPGTCRRFTLMVGHNFSLNGCPAPIPVSNGNGEGGTSASGEGSFVAGFDAITWTVISCSEPGCTGEESLVDLSKCPPIEAACPSIPPEPAD